MSEVILFRTSASLQADKAFRPLSAKHLQALRDCQHVRIVARKLTARMTPEQRQDYRNLRDLKYSMAETLQMVRPDLIPEAARLLAEAKRRLAA